MEYNKFIQKLDLFNKYNLKKDDIIMNMRVGLSTTPPPDSFWKTFDRLLDVREPISKTMTLVRQTFNARDLMILNKIQGRPLELLKYPVQAAKLKQFGKQSAEIEVRWVVDKTKAALDIVQP